jgi:hypothetical protein
MKTKQYPSQAELKQILDYNPDIGIFTWKARLSQSSKIGDVAGSKYKNGYIVIRANLIRYYAHRLAWIYIFGEISNNIQIDHVNGIRNDNRLINLRLATQSQNNYNQKLSIKNTSGFKGICWDKKVNKWVARIQLNGKTHHLGTFTDKASAIAAVMQAREAMHGEFTNHGEIHLARPIPTPTLF